MFKENADGAGISLISSWGSGSAIQKFSGIAYHDDKIIIGQEGYEACVAENVINPEQLWDGRFSLMQQSGSDALALTDYMGQELLFFFYDGVNWAVSNSFLYLVEFLALQHVKLTPYKLALTPYLVPHSFTQQLISQNTGVAEIKMLPATSLIRVKGGNFSIESRISRLPGKKTKSNYAEILIEYASKWASRCAALLEAYPDRSRVDITGGRDSRVVLGLMKMGVGDLSSINFYSVKQYVKDYEIAKSLGETFGFRIRNKGIPISNGSPEAVFELWKYGNLGVYYPVYLAGGVRPAEAIHFHGAGGGCLRQVYGAKFLDHLLRKFNNTSEFDAAFRKEYLTALKYWGVSDTENPAARISHYQNARSRLHFGRNWYRSLSSRMATPLASWDLVQAVSLQTERERARAQIYCDLLLLCSPELATFPFDTPEKSFSQETLSSSPFAKSRPLINKSTTRFKVYRPMSTEITAQVTRPEIDYQKLMLRDMRMNRRFAESLQIFPDQYYEKAKHELSNNSSIVTGARTAAHIIAVGEIIKNCQ